MYIVLYKFYYFIFLKLIDLWKRADHSKNCSHSNIEICIKVVNKIYPKIFRNFKPSQNLIIMLNINQLDTAKSATASAPLDNPYSSSHPPAPLNWRATLSGVVVNKVHDFINCCSLALWAHQSKWPQRGRSSYPLSKNTYVLRTR